MPTSDFHLLVAGVPGAMALGCVEVALDRGLNVLPLSLSGSKSGDHPVCTEQVCVNMKLFPVDEHDKAIDEALTHCNNDPSKILVVDYTAPAAVPKNVELYVRRGLSFVLGTTGPHSADPATIIEQVCSSAAAAEGVCAVVAPNMNKQIVAFQAMVDYGARTFPGSFEGFEVSVKESHQKTKKDTSGTAKAVCASFAQLVEGGEKKSSVSRSMSLSRGAAAADDELGLVTQKYIGGVDKIRTDDRAMAELGVPKQHLDGHAFHTYRVGSLLFCQYR